MIDGFWYGILGGLFGPAFGKWMSRFKYWIIFLVAMLGTHIIFFAFGAQEKGFRFAIHAVREYTFTPVGILFPVGVGLFFVLVTFLRSSEALGKPKE